jgi:hypothetical protein
MNSDPVRKFYFFNSKKGRAYLRSEGYTEKDIIEELVYNKQSDLEIEVDNATSPDVADAWKAKMVSQGYTEGCIANYIEAAQRALKTKIFLSTKDEGCVNDDYCANTEYQYVENDYKFPDENPKDTFPPRAIPPLTLGEVKKLRELKPEITIDEMLNEQRGRGT